MGAKVRWRIYRGKGFRGWGEVNFLARQIKGDPSARGPKQEVECCPVPELDEVAQERDQLLEAIEALRGDRIEDEVRCKRPEERLRPHPREVALYALADQIKSKEGGDASAEPSRARRRASTHATRGGSNQVEGVAPDPLREIVSAVKQHRNATVSRLKLLAGAARQPESSDCMLKPDRDLYEVLDRVSASLSSEAGSEGGEG